MVARDASTGNKMVSRLIKMVSIGLRIGSSRFRLRRIAWRVEGLKGFRDGDLGKMGLHK
jgi:hypothetical protein